MPTQQAGFGAQSQSNTVNNAAALRKAADDALNAYLDSISDASLQKKHRRFFEDLARVQGQYVNFPVPPGAVYLNELDEWINACNIHKRLGFGDYVLDRENKLEIGPDFARLKKNAKLTPEQALSLAMAIYHNPKARNGVSVMGTKEEREMLEAAMDEINAMNPDAHQIKILNRITPAPALNNAQPQQQPPAGGGNPQPGPSNPNPTPGPGNGPTPQQPPTNSGPVNSTPHPQPDPGPKVAPSNEDAAPQKRKTKAEMLAEIDPDSVTAHKIWEEIKKYAAKEGPRIREPELDPNEKNADVIARHSKDMQDYNEAIKEYWDENPRLHVEWIKSAGGSIPMPDQSDDMSSKAKVKPTPSKHPFKFKAKGAATDKPVTREDVQAKIHENPDIAAKVYGFIHDHLKKEEQKDPSPADIEKRWTGSKKDTQETLLHHARESVAEEEAQKKADAVATASTVEPIDLDTADLPPMENITPAAATPDAKPVQTPAADTPSFVAPATPAAAEAKKPADAKKSFANGAAKKAPGAGINDDMMREARIHIIDTHDASQKGLKGLLGIGASRANTILSKLEEEGVVGPKQESGLRRVPARSNRRSGGEMRQDIS